VIYVPAGLERLAPTVPAALFANYDPRHITGCVLSGLLSSRRADLSPTVGLVSPRDCLHHYCALEVLGFRAAGLHCEGFAVDGGAIREFRHRFGGVQDGGPKATAGKAEVALT
jgi:hypothetical protein